MTECYLVQNSSKDRIKFLHLKVEKDTMHSTWGLLGGKTQNTSNTYGSINTGKANELSPVDAAIADFDRKKARKVKNGYREVPDLNNITQVKEDVIDFDNPPTSFCPSKPISKAPKKLPKNYEFQIKENGMCHYAFIGTTGDIKLYTRRMDDHTAKYPGIVGALSAYRIPQKSILGIELVVSPGHGNHQENFHHIQKINKTDCLKGKLKTQDQIMAINYQKDHRVRGCVFYAFYIAGEEILDVSKSLAYIKTLFPVRSDKSAMYQPWVVKADSMKEAKTYIRSKKGNIEGLVLWDLDDQIDIGFSGKPKRRAAYKVKLVLDTDVVATGWEEGKGKRQGMIGSLKIGQYDNTGSFIELGTVGGLTDEQADPSGWNFPCVVEIKYDAQNSNGHFIFPRFSKIHEDKLPEDCKC